MSVVGCCVMVRESGVEQGATNAFTAGTAAADMSTAEKKLDFRPHIMVVVLLCREM